jgi:pyroglutamyl-peptidase
MTSPVLLSGFEPFAGAEINESWQAVQLAAPVLRDTGIEVETVLLPVEFGRGAVALLEAIGRWQPNVVVATGLAGGRTAVTPERTAVNVQDARIPDNAGASPVDRPCVEGGPVGYFSTLPIKSMVQVVRGTTDVPAAVSQTAGTFVCNDVFYRLQHALATEPQLAGVRGGFVHVPAAGDLAVELSARALAIMVQAVLELADGQDLAISGGTEQ